MREKSLNGYYFNSFDRFGDDLCQHLLSYLLVSDKIRYECVSKQWQQLIYNKQNKVVFTFYGHNERDSAKNIITNNSIAYASNGIFGVTISIFEKIVKKFKFIQQLVICSDFMLDSKLLEIIYKNCPHLKKFISTSSGIFRITREAFRNFGQRLGQNLEYIRFDNLRVEQTLELLKPMTSLRYIYFDNKTFSITECTQMLQILSQNLVNIEEIEFCTYSLTIIKILADNYGTKLTKFTLPLRVDDLNEILIEISRFERIEKLDLNLMCSKDENISQIDSSLLTIAKNCSKLKILRLVLNSARDCDLISGQLFKILSEFQTLEKLNLWYSRCINTCGPIQSFKPMVHLKYLRIFVFDLYESHFKEFTKHCPHIKVHFEYSNLKKWFNFNKSINNSLIFRL
jgi:hypothetical protein